MGLLDSLTFDPSTYGGQGGGLLGLLQSYSQMAGMPDLTKPVTQAAVPSAQPDSFVPIGDYQMPMFGKPDPAQLPINAQPAQGVLPQASAPAAQDTPFMQANSSPFTAGLANFAAGHGLISKLLGAAQGFSTGQRLDPLGMQQQQLSATYQSLISSGVPRNLAYAAALNPKILETIAPAYFDGAPKLQETGTDPMTGQKSFGVWEPGERKLTPIGQGNGPTQGGASTGGQDTSLNSFQTALKNGVTGEALYQYLPPGMAQTVKGMIEGRVQPPSTIAMRSPTNLALINAANAIDPNFDATSWKSRSTFNQQMGSAQPGAVGGQKNLMGTALGHLAELADKAVDLGNVDTPIAAVGQAANAVKNMTTTNAAKVNGLNEAAARFAGEVGKLYSGSQGGGVHEREDTRSRFGGNKTSAELASALETSKELIQSKLEALEQQRRDVFGQNSQFDFVGDKGREAIAKIDTAIAKLRGQGSGNSPQSQAAPSQAAPPVSEGMTATNPKTGERVILQNGKWVPFA